MPRHNAIEPSRSHSILQKYDRERTVCSWLRHDKRHECSARTSAVPHGCTAETVWAMTAMALRIAKTQGMAIDGSSCGLPPFPTEMRRRLWWALMDLNGRAKESVDRGGGDIRLTGFTVRPPTNLSDVDLFPFMTRLPGPRIGATEMTYVQLRNSFSFYLSSIPRIGKGTRHIAKDRRRMSRCIGEDEPR